MATSLAMLFALLATLTKAKLTIEYDQGPKPLGSPADLSWSIDSDANTISFGLEVSDAILRGNGTMWVGIGVGEETSGSMLGADILTAEFNATELNKCTIMDRYVPFVAFPIGEEPGVFPEQDDCQSWTLESCSRDPQRGTITLEVYRPLSSGSTSRGGSRLLAILDNQDREVGSGVQSIMYAYGNGNFAYHTKNRGTMRMVLFNDDFTYPTGTILPLSDDVTFNFSIVATNYTVPPKTTYACTSALVPLLKSGKRFMVAADPIIRSTSGANKAHHLIAYACSATEYGRNFLNGTAECGSSGGPTNPDAKCKAFLYGWAVGGGRFMVPDDVGFLIDESTQFIILETHYDNPNDEENAVDVSGATLYFADERPTEAGMLVLGDGIVSLAPQQVQHDYNYTSTCPSNCTQTWDNDINVFASLLHMHTTGREIYTNRYDKDGNFLETTNSIKFWSNDHQVGTFFDKPKIIKRGDILSTTCVYDTTKRNTTRFGGRTEDEMCIDFVFYYPIVKRQPQDGAMFFCSMVNIAESNFNATSCGMIPRDLNFESNPSFNDTVGLPDKFGEPRGDNETCSLLVAQEDATESVCFPQEASVRSRRGNLKMSDIRIGDEVAVGDGLFSPVFMFTHRDVSGTHKFVELSTATARLRLTAGHFLYVNNNLVRADEVRVGDKLEDEHGHPLEVIKVAVVTARGLYNPQTLHGDIVVDNVRASTYTHAVEPWAAHALLAPLRYLSQWLGWSCAVFHDNHSSIVRGIRSALIG